MIHVRTYLDEGNFIAHFRERLQRRQDVLVVFGRNVIQLAIGEEIIAAEEVERVRLGGVLEGDEVRLAEVDLTLLMHI